MSRSHMLYDNKPLESIPVTPVQWETPWNAENIFRYDSDGGILVEGTVQSRSRFSIRDKTPVNTKWRYVVLHVTVTRAIKRKFDASGKEMEPNFGETKKVSTGYLMSSYIKELQALTEYKESAYKNCISFWWDEKELEKIELSAGDHIRLRTKGNGPYIDSLSKLDQQTSTVSNYSGGESTGALWTDKVMSFKKEEHEDDDRQEGVDEDEWDD
ncbi:Arpin [Exaiptasia diaphana]|nr:Arpin [Exaiptasia diaphana]